MPPLPGTAGTVDPLYPEPDPRPRWVAEEPLRWFGAAISRRERPDLDTLIRRGVVSAEVAALLAGLAAHRHRILIIAGRSGAGKSALLEALLPWFPENDRRIRLRGGFETFRWETDERFRPGATVLVADEISPHLPIYLWGAPVARFLAWAAPGCALAATAHGERIEDVVRLLAGPPLHLPLRAIAAFDIVVRLVPAPGGGEVDAVWSVGLERSGGLTRVELVADGVVLDAGLETAHRSGRDGRAALTGRAGSVGQGGSGQAVEL